MWQRVAAAPCRRTRRAAATYLKELRAKNWRLETLKAMRETFSQQGKKATAVALAAVLIAAPVGVTTYAGGSSAYGNEDSAVYNAQWLESTYSQSVVDAVAQYWNGEITASALTEQLQAACRAGEVSQAGLDELLTLLESGLLDDAPTLDDGAAGNGDAADGSGAGDTPAAGGDAANGDGTTADGGASDGSTPDADGTLDDGAPDGATADPSDDAPASGGDSTGEGETPADDATDAAATGDEATATESFAEPIPSSGEYTPHHYTQDLTTEKFIAVIGEQARQIAQENDLYASVMIAQAILESASGNSLLSQAPNNNLFGIKGYWNGQCVNMTTWEESVQGHYYAIRANFRKYDTLSDSLNDYAALLTKGLGGYYSGAWKSNAETPADACDFLEGRYATSSSYSESLQDLIETYDLTRFDEPLDYEPVDSYELPVVDEETGEVVLDEEGQPVMESHDLADLLAEVTSYLGTDYVWGGDTPEEGFDCSGLVRYCYEEALGVTLPRTTYFQWRVGETVDFDDLHPGDLLFFEEDGDVHHVAMYLGDGYYIHAPQEGDVVKVTSMEEYTPSFAKRIVETKPVDEEAADASADDANAKAKAEVLKSGKEETQTALSGMLWRLVDGIAHMSIG